MTYLNSTDLLLLESRVVSRGPNMGVAYLCCIFGGVLGVHRFYLGRPLTGLLMLVTLGFLGIGVLIDLFTIPGMVRKDRDKIRIEELKALDRRQAEEPKVPTYVAPAPRVDAALVRKLLAERFPA
jgi:hypothetical protein